MTMLDYDDHVRAKAAPWVNGVEIATFCRLQNGDTKVATIQWDAGIRPTERAAEHHIADLRRVAFKALEIE
jgi:hypothetical protein